MQTKWIKSKQSSETSSGMTHFDEMGGLGRDDLKEGFEV
jgi:hypothetical protein